jgi:hypothetical protein
METGMLKVLDFSLMQEEVVSAGSNPHVKYFKSPPNQLD